MYRIGGRRPKSTRRRPKPTGTPQIRERLGHRANREGLLDARKTYTSCVDNPSTYRGGHRKAESRSSGDLQAGPSRTSRASRPTAALDDPSIASDDELEQENHQEQNQQGVGEDEEEEDVDDDDADDARRRRIREGKRKACASSEDEEGDTGKHLSRRLKKPRRK